MTNLESIIDSYGTLKTELGKLEAQKKALEKALTELPAGSYESEKYRLTISNSLSQVPDKELAEQQKAVAEAAIEEYRKTLSRQYLAAHTIEKSVRSHRIGLPTGKDLAA